MLTIDDYNKMSAEEIMEWFFYRKTPFAIKSADGEYYPVKIGGKKGSCREVTIRDIEKHMRGEHVIGAYNCREDETCQWACIDFDNRRYVEIAKKIAERKFSLEFAKNNRCIEIETMYELSEKKGCHVWFFFKEPVDMWAAHYLLTEILKANKLEAGRNNEIDIFPKKPELTGKMIGAMVRLPKYRKE